MYNFLFLSLALFSLAKNGNVLGVKDGGGLSDFINTTGGKK